MIPHRGRRSFELTSRRTNCMMAVLMNVDRRISTSWASVLLGVLAWFAWLQSAHGQ